MSSIDPNTAGQAGQTVTPKPATPPTPGEDLMQAMGGALAPIMQHLGAIMQAQGADGVGEVKSQASIQKAEDNSSLLSGATQGQSISNPQLPNAVHADIDKYIDKFVLSIAGQDPFQGKEAASPELAQVANALQAMRSIGNEDAGGSKSSGSVQGTQAVGGVGGAGGSSPVTALAGLGGLVATSLFEILAKFAKEQSNTEKLASDLTIKLHKAEIEGAKSQAQIVEEKAAIAVAALVAQMVVGIATCAIQVGAAGYAASTMGKTGGMSENVATTMFTPTVTAVTGAMSTLGDRGAEAIKTMMTAPLEMQEIMLRAFNDMIQRASQSTDKMDADAHDLVAQALQLLDRMMDALNQNFNKIGH